MKTICTIYKSSKKDETYLYVELKEDLTRVPKPLLESFGRAIKVMTLIMTPERKLARTEATKVLEAIKEQGFYLQLPPPKEEYMILPKDRKATPSCVSSADS